MTKAELRRKWFENERRRKWQVNKWKGKIYKVLRSQLTTFSQHYALSGFVANPDTLIISQDISRVLYQLMLDVGVREANTSYLEVKNSKRASIGFDEEFAREIIRLLGDKGLVLAVNINNVTKELILELISQGVEQGLGQVEIARLILETGLQPIGRFSIRQRANLIARTEVLRAANQGRMIGAKKTGLKLKKIWSSAQQYRTRGSRAKDRADHLHMNGQTVDFNDKFTDPRLNAQLMQPGDPEAPAATTINCRCAVVFESVKDSQGNILRA